MPIDNVPENPFDESKKPLKIEEFEEYFRQVVEDQKAALERQALLTERERYQAELALHGYREGTVEYNQALTEWDTEAGLNIPLTHKDALWARVLEDQANKRGRKPKTKGTDTSWIPK